MPQISPPGGHPANTENTAKTAKIPNLGEINENAMDKLLEDDGRHDEHAEGLNDPAAHPGRPRQPTREPGTRPQRESGSNPSLESATNNTKNRMTQKGNTAPSPGGDKTHQQKQVGDQARSRTTPLAARRSKLQSPRRYHVVQALETTAQLWCLQSLP